MRLPSSPLFLLAITLLSLATMAGPASAERGRPVIDDSLGFELIDDLGHRWVVEGLDRAALDHGVDVVGDGLDPGSDGLEGASLGRNGAGNLSNVL